MMKKLHLLFLVLFFCVGAKAQTLLWYDSFEHATNTPDGVSTRTPSMNGSSGGPPATRYFWRCQPNQIASVNTYTGLNGSWMFAGEDHRLSVSGSQDNAPQSITWANINITGKTNLSFKGLFASGNGSGESWDLPPGTNADYVIVEYRINGTGDWKKGLAFYPHRPTQSSYLSLDKNGDETGDDVEGERLISPNFTAFTFLIPETGNSLELRLRAHSNSTSEEWAVDNFEIWENTTLPVTLNKFEIKKQNHSVSLNWVTASEQHNKEFIVYRSGDDKVFAPIATLSGAGNSTTTNNYSYIDSEPLNGNNYYRLAQVDFDGKETVLDERVLNFNISNQDIMVYPNPVSEKIIVDFQPRQFNKAELTDIQGKTLQTIKINAGDTQCVFDLSALPAGTYLIRLTGDKNAEHRKVVKR